MRPEVEGMLLVRAELCERLESLRALSRRHSSRDFAERVQALKRLAAAYGLAPVVAVAEALERTVAEGDHACPRQLYLARLHDAIGCDRLDSAASEAILASVSVRLCA